ARQRAAGPAHAADRRCSVVARELARRRARSVRRAAPVRAPREPRPAHARRGAGPARASRPGAGRSAGARGVSAIVAAIASGTPTAGPRTVHVDVTNACNAACITCWDHSPLLHEPRSAAWKKQRWDLAAFEALVADLAAMGTVKNVILSGMGDPLVHPDIY